ncbi:MAG TPA: hypothetical protein VMH23_19795 [Bacteroidota bacterium]|nr:hypothetical protein [Bacteroidota bacterium]
MQSNAAVVATILGKSLVSFVCCFIVGLVIFQGGVFHPQFWQSQIVMFSIAGSIFFYTLRVSRRNAFAVLLVLFVVSFGLLFRQNGLLRLAGDFLFFAALASALYGFFELFYTKTVTHRNLQPLVLATMFAILFAFATVLVSLLYSAVGHKVTTSIFDSALANAKYEFLVGLGIGIGILLIDNGFIHWATRVLRRLLGSLRASFREFGDRL